jgi:mRNA-degrading endonuclease RelE of RelBE toxin-antitoxin system
MVKLVIHADARGDIAKIRTSSPKAAARIIFALEEILRDDQDLLDRLTQHDFGLYESAFLHVSKWLEEWTKGNNLWRFKLWDLERHGLPYRIIYAFYPIKQIILVLGVAHRSFNYDPNHPIARRILDAYHDL